MSEDSRGHSVTRRKALAIGAGVGMAAIAAAGYAIYPTVRWYLDGSNPQAPQAVPTGLTAGNDFDFIRRTVELNNGVQMPINGLGTYDLTIDEAAQSVYWALADGVRLIDCAHAYNNESGVAEGLRRAIDDGIVSREEVFVTTKLWYDDYSEEGLQGAFDRLGLEYIDLLLIHQPQNDYERAWSLMEDAYDEGRLRAIGLSNFSDGQFSRIAAQARVIPAVLQVETHLHNQHVAMKGFLDQYGTVLEAWYPLGGRGNTQTYFQDPTVLDIAQSHGVTAAQVISRWHIQDGHIVIPGSSNEEHIHQNNDIYGFELSDSDMETLRSLDQKQAYFSMIGQTSAETEEKFGEKNDEP